MMTQNLSDFDNEDLEEAISDLQLLSKKLRKKKAFWTGAKITEKEQKALKLAKKDDSYLTELGEDVLDKQVKVLSKFLTRVKKARNEKKKKKQKAAKKAEEGGTLSGAEKARMTKLKSNISKYCRIIGIDNEWSDSDNFDAIKIAHADLNKRSVRTGHLRTLDGKWNTVFDGELIFPDESAFPKTGKELELFYFKWKEIFKEKKAEISEDNKWDKTYFKRAQKLLQFKAKPTAKIGEIEFFEDMAGAPALAGDYKLWDLERFGATYGLPRRDEYKKLRLDTVSIKRENLLKLMKSHKGALCDQIQELGVVRTVYGKIVSHKDGYVATFPAKKSRGKKRKKSEEDKEEEEAIEVCFCYIVFVCFVNSFSHLF
jgi:hypothetical protein